MKKPNSTVIFNFRSCLVNTLLKSNQSKKRILTDDAKLIINVIDQLDTDSVMKKKAIYPVANTIKKLHIQKNIHLIYKQDFYKYKKKEIDENFIEYLVIIMDDLDHIELIE